MSLRIEVLTEPGRRPDVPPRKGIHQLPVNEPNPLLEPGRITPGALQGPLKAVEHLEEILENPIPLVLEEVAPLLQRPFLDVLGLSECIEVLGPEFLGLGAQTNHLIVPLCRPGLATSTRGIGLKSRQIGITINRIRALAVIRISHHLDLPPQNHGLLQLLE